MANFKSFGQLGNNRINNDQVIIDSLDLGSDGHWLRASRINQSGDILGNAITFVPEALDTSFRFEDVLSDRSGILATLKTVLGRVAIIRRPNKSDVSIFYSSGTEFDGAVAIKAEDYLLVDADDTIFVDASSNPVTITLPANPAHGEIYVIKCINATFTCLVARNGKKIDDAALNKVLVLNESLMFQYETSFGWGII